MMDELRANAEAALRALWTMANAEDAAHGERVKLLQWFVEMGVGKPAAMDRGERREAGGGVILLPCVLPDGFPTGQFEECQEGEKTAPGGAQTAPRGKTERGKTAKGRGKKSERND